MLKSIKLIIKNNHFVLEYILKYKKWIILLVILDLIGSSFLYVLPLTFKYIIDSVLINKNYAIFGKILIIVIIIAIISGITEYVSAFLKPYLTGKLYYENTLKLLPKAINSDEAYNLGEITNSLTNLLKSANGLISTTLPSLIKNILQILITIITLLIMDVRLTILIFIPASIIFIFVFLISKKIKAVTREQIDIFSNVFTIIKSIFGNKNFINVFALDNFFLGIYKDILKDYVKKQKKIAHLYASQMVVGLLFFMVPSMILIFYGCQLIITEKVSLGIVTMFVSYLVTLAEILTYTSSLVSNFQQTVPAVNKIEKFYKAKPKKYGDKQLNITNGEIEINHIHFEYDRVIFEDLNCKFKKGINILSGPNGIGKSTLLNMITRIINLPDGKILIDKTDINHISEESLRENIGFVMTNPFIFDSTLKTNICLDMDISDEKLMDIIKKVKLDNLLNKLPKGLDTILTGDNINLSSGEQQKISLARVLLRNPNIILLDEVGDNIDKQSLKSIYECLNELKKEKTIIIVDHHLQMPHEDWNIIDLSKKLSNQKNIYEKETKVKL